MTPSSASRTSAWPATSWAGSRGWRCATGCGQRLPTLRRCCGGCDSCRTLKGVVAGASTTVAAPYPTLHASKGWARRTMGFASRLCRKSLSVGLRSETQHWQRRTPWKAGFRKLNPAYHATSYWHGIERVRQSLRRYHPTGRVARSARRRMRRPAEMGVAP